MAFRIHFCFETFQRIDETNKALIWFFQNFTISLSAAAYFSTFLSWQIPIPYHFLSLLSKHEKDVFQKHV